MPTTSPESRPLSRAEAFALLPEATYGRIVFISRALPAHGELARARLRPWPCRPIQIVAQIRPELVTAFRTSLSASGHLP